MTQEQKQLLLTVLCAMLQYKIIGQYVLGEQKYGEPEELLNLDIQTGKVDCSDSTPYDVENFKPYLRPMSSMTEEEKEKLLSIIREETHIICEKLKNNDCGIEEGKYHFYNILELDFLLSHHFDYRGLIDKGLALEAPEGMYH